MPSSKQGGGSRERRGQRMREHERDEFTQRVLDIARVTRVMAGGKRMRFRACIVIGDGKGKVGYGLAKGADVSLAISKAIAKAKKQMLQVPIVDGTIPHEVWSKFHAAKVMMKPAPQGTGVIAGATVRAVVELAGITNIVSKLMGSKNVVNNVKATFNGLASLRPAPEKAARHQQAKPEVVKGAV